MVTPAVLRVNVWIPKGRSGRTAESRGFLGKRAVIELNFLLSGLLGVPRPGV